MFKVTFPKQCTVSVKFMISSSLLTIKTITLFLLLLYSLYILNFLEDYVMLMLYLCRGKNLKGKTCEMSYIFFKHLL